MNQHAGAIAVLVLCCASTAQPEPDEIRYRVEIINSLHVRARTDESVRRLRRIVAKACPGLKVPCASRLEIRDYFFAYRNRLLADAETSWEQIVERVGAANERAIDRAIARVEGQIRRELTVRGIYRSLRRLVREGESLKSLYRKLKEHDDADRPICSTKPGAGLVVYRDLRTEALTGKELGQVNDSGVAFSHPFRLAVERLGWTRPPSIGRSALGTAGEGQQIVRLLAVAQTDRGRERATRDRMKWLHGWLWQLYPALRHKRHPLATLKGIVEGETDAWGRRLAFEVIDGGFRVASRGADGKLGTEDDIRFPALE